MSSFFNCFSFSSSLLFSSLKVENSVVDIVFSDSFSGLIKPKIKNIKIYNYFLVQ